MPEKATKKIPVKKKAVKKAVKRAPAKKAATPVTVATVQSKALEILAAKRTDLEALVEKLYGGFPSGVNADNAPAFMKRLKAIEAKK